MDLTNDINQITATRDKLKTIGAPSGVVRDAISRCTILIGKLQLIEDEGKVAAAAVADVAEQLKTAAANAAPKLESTNN